MSRESKEVAREGLIAAAVALGVRLVFVFWAWDRVPPTADGSFYHVVAERIAQGDGYTWLWPDGAVTYAAHYPVGYPSMMAVVYRLFGAVPGWAMVQNALIGSLAVYCAHVLGASLVAAHFPQRSARIGRRWASLLLALSPTLILYTPALMTEGTVGALLVCAAYAAWRIRGAAMKSLQAWLFFALLALLLAAATYMRPQSILMAPVLGFVAQPRWRASMVSAFLLSTLTLLAVAPWTLRNCDKMERCVFVSANGGWNLLIGTFPEGQGAWVPLEGERVPTECREVFAEAAKDECFGNAGKRRILAAPGRWLSLVPAKLRATFDYSAAGAEHLRAAGAVDDGRKYQLQIVEYAWQRSVSLLALLGMFFLARGAHPLRGRWLSLLLIVGVLGFVGAAAWLGWLCVLALGLSLRRDVLQVPLAQGLSTLFFTGLIYAVFFGAGRYSLAMWLAVGPLMAAGAAAVSVWFLGWRERKSL